ncbi:putative disease resistance protein RGA3 [Bienertia sinuspersici]
MLESLTLQNDGLSDIEAMTKKLQEKLKGDKYLLILDDVWEKSQSLWDSLINILQRIGDPSKNVILITTRSAEVANKARVTKTYSLNGLSEDDGWTLLQQKAFSTRRSGQKNSDFEGVGRKIIRKCVGVPLAIKAMGAILQSKERPLDWESILTSELWDLPQKDENNILPSLRLSYNHLPHVSVKQCFAYCAVFPKDSKLNKHVLIALWMAQGLLPKSQRANSTTTMEHVGEDYFGFLLNNSFIEEEEVNEIGEVKWYKMHDLVHDLAIYVSKKNMLVWKAGSQLKEVSGARHFMIDFEKGKITPEMPPEVDICKLRTLNFMSGLPRWKSIICAQYMRVLILANIGLSDIPNGIGQLIHLRYLDLSGNDIKTLPESVFKLYQLQTLILKSNYFLEELPAGLYKLENLMHIKTNNLLSIPRGLGLLTNLQTLPSLELNDEIEGWKIDELENLNHIKGKVWISGLENVKNKEEAEKASLRKKIGIQKVRLKWNHVRKESNKNEMMKNNDEDVLGSLEPPPYMKSLSVTGFMGLGFPRWMKTMDLIMVELIDCERCGQLPTLGQLPNLKILKLEGFKKVEIIGNEFYYESSSSNTNNSTYNVGIIGREDHKLFGALKQLYFTNFECLATWMPCPVTTAFPSLENVEMRDCPNLEKVPTLHSQSLKYLYLDNVGGTQTLDIIKYNHTNLEKLKISDCKNLKSFPNGEVEMMMTSLKELDICDCPALGGIPTSIDNCTSLKSLTIRGCSSIEGPVPDLSKLQSLEGLDLRNSGELLELEARSIPQLYHLRELKIGEFREKEEIISFVSQIKSSHSPSLPLRNVELIGWPKVKNMPQELQHLLSSSTLQRLEIVGFDELDALPEWIGNLSSLQALWLFDCEELKYLPSKQAMLRLSRLQHIHIINCPQLKERCSRQNNAPDSQWPNIQHIPNIVFH